VAKILRSSTGFFYADSAAIAGDVVIGADSSLWFNAVVRGDVAPIRLGARVNVQDGSVLHCDTGTELVIEDEVSIGHLAVVHGEHVGAGTLIGMGARVLGHARIGRQCIIAAGAVVPEGMLVPDHSVIMGVPGRIRRSVSPEEIEYISWISRHYVQLAQRWLSGEFTSLT
jgi:carbonic anhydrase/acetyltransferase-like protein (isoleucine patch superfamily)